MTQSSAVIPINFNPTVYEALESADNVIFFQWDLNIIYTVSITRAALRGNNTIVLPACACAAANGLYGFGQKYIW